MLRLLAAALLLAGCAQDPAPSATPEPDAAALEAPPEDEVAVAEIQPIGDGTVSGTVTFTQLDDAVEVRLDLADFRSEGLHGLHVHETGDCGPDSTGTPGGAAGGHFNPLSSPHGAPGERPGARHAGDLGNVEPEATGRAVGASVDSVLALSGPTSVLGRAVILHAAADDLTSQPSGDAGARIGCGVVRAARPPAGSSAVPAP